MQFSPIEEIASYVFQIEKKEREFIYEIKLLKTKFHNEYCVLRRWYYKDDLDKQADWIASDWSEKNQTLFDRKVVQKVSIMKYKTIQNTDLRQDNK
jgi:hypothetical protein